MGTNTTTFYYHVFDVIDQLRQGKQLKVSRGRIGMGVDLSVGYVMHNQTTGEELIVGDITIRQLAELIEQEGITTI